MLIQDIYIIGVKLHHILQENRIHFTRSEEEHTRVWQLSIEQLRPLVTERQMHLIDACKDIDWSLYS